MGIMGFRITIDYVAELLEITNVTAGNVTVNGSLIHNVGQNEGSIDVIWYSTEQTSLFRRKKRRAQAAVAAATVAAAGEGAAPIPFADCALLIPTQISMIATITVLFGFDVNKSVITALLSSSIGAGGATLLGKTVVTNLSEGKRYHHKDGTHEDPE